MTKDEIRARLQFLQDQSLQIQQSIARLIKDLEDAK